MIFFQFDIAGANQTDGLDNLDVINLIASIIGLIYLMTVIGWLVYQFEIV